MDEEIDAGVVSVVGGVEQYNYILIRNHIITKGRENASIWVSKDMFVDVIPNAIVGYWILRITTCYRTGYIDFGVALAIKDRIPAAPSKTRENVIEAGLAGLAAAR